MRIRFVRMLAVGVLCAVVVPSGRAEAQTPAAAPALDPNEAVRFEVTGGYQILRVPDQTFPFGLNIDAAWNRTPALGLVGEIGFAMHSEDEGGADVDVTAWNVGVGPRWNYRGTPRAWPFAQVLVGALHARTSAEILGQDFSDSATKFMVQPGAGVNVNVGDGWGVVGAVDYRRVFLDEDEDGESGENEFRVFFGVRLLLD